MPSQILHTLFGEDVISEIFRRIHGSYGLVAEKALRRITKDFRNVFVLGCQGPDIFYHNQRLRPVGLEYGTLLHRRGYGVFTATLLKMSLPDPPPDEEDIRAGRREKGINALGVYSLGFMTHAVLDRFCHPYIIYKSVKIPAGGPGGNEDPLGRLAHPFFERILDVLMLKILRNGDILSWDQEGILAGICENPPLGLKELIARALCAGFPERAGNDARLSLRIDNTFADAAHFYHMSAPRIRRLVKKNAPGSGLQPDGGMRAVLYPASEDLPADIDYLNLKHEAWYYPCSPPPPAADAPVFTSFPDIYVEAVQAAADAFTPSIETYLKNGMFPIADAAKSIGNGSLSLPGAEGKPRAPERSSPLPLDRVLFQELDIKTE
jgi:hypothetical protein